MFVKLKLQIKTWPNETFSVLIVSFLLLIHVQGFSPDSLDNTPSQTGVHGHREEEVEEEEEEEDEEEECNVTPLLRHRAGEVSELEDSRHLQVNNSQVKVKERAGGF